MSYRDNDSELIRVLVYVNVCIYIYIHTDLCIFYVNFVCVNIYECIHFLYLCACIRYIYESQILKEQIQEIYVDKVVERVVEVAPTNTHTHEHINTFTL